MANIFTQNPIRVDSSMGSDYLTTIGLTSRPLKIVEIVIENPTPTAGTWTITDGAGTPNTIWEITLPATAGNFTDNTQRMWKNFKAPAPPAGWVMWIHRR